MSLRNGSGVRRCPLVNWYRKVQPISGYLSKLWYVAFMYILEKSLCEAMDCCYVYHGTLRCNFKISLKITLLDLCVYCICSPKFHKRSLGSYKLTCVPFYNQRALSGHAFALIGPEWFQLYSSLCDVLTLVRLKPVTALLVLNITSFFTNTTSNSLWVQKLTLKARFMGPTWGPSGADRTQVGHMLAPWILLSGKHFRFCN